MIILLRRTSRINDRRIALINIKAIEVHSNPFNTNPKEVPAAGGCSVLVITMKNIPIPTDKAARISSMYRDSDGWYIENICKSNESAIIDPIIEATKCPPITLRGVAATLFGTTNTVNAEAATPTTMATCNKLSPTNSITNNDKDAKRH